MEELQLAFEVEDLPEGIRRGHYYTVEPLSNGHVRTS